MFIRDFGHSQEPLDVVIISSQPQITCWPELLRYNGLADFEALWRLQIPWYEPPNHARDGWSGVSRFDLNLPTSGRVGVFIKRQQNYRMRSLWHPLQGEATLAREWRNLQRFRARCLATQRPVYFAQRCVDSGLQAILITEALDGYLPLDLLLQQWQTATESGDTARSRMIDSLAATISRIHGYLISHNCLYPKHILVKETESGLFDIRIIDLEKTKRLPVRVLATIRDLERFKRHTTMFRDDDWQRFFQRYFRDWRCPALARWTLARILKRAQRKGRRGSNQGKALWINW